MSLEIELIGGFNPFEWDALKCPVCGKNEFTSLSHSDIYCDYCNARFAVRHTCGDQGCVIDCFPEEENRCTDGPKFKCLDCDAQFGSLSESPLCPEDPAHNVGRVEGIFRSVKLPDDYPKRFCLILKVGDYCSSWGNPDRYDYPHSPYELDYPTQEEWNEFQEKVLR